MMPAKAKITRKLGKPGVPPLGRSPGRMREDVREYIGAMATELAELALYNGLDALAVACDVAREVAEGKVSSAGRRLDCH
jgi:hypothetical protein